MGFLGGILEALVAISRHRVFSLVEAQTVLPIIIHITERAQRDLEYHKRCLKTLQSGSDLRAQEVKTKIESIIETWEQKVERLGGSPKGLWMIDFDNGQGFWCWKFPEQKIIYSHGYHDGYSGRKIICETSGEHE